MASREALRRQRDQLQMAWARCMRNGTVDTEADPVQPPVRPEVAESWRRSLTVVDPEQDSAPTTDGGDSGHRWRHSPLREPVLSVADELRAITEDAGFVAAVTDESGTILWTCGGRVMRRRASTVNFAPGGRWDEGAMGTNALSLALRSGVPASVFSAEHLVHALHGWVCYCAPIHGPDGSVLGVLDLSSTWDRSHPLAMPAVRTLAASVESQLVERYGPGADLRTGAGGAPRAFAPADPAAPALGEPRRRPLLTGHDGRHLSCLGEPGLTINGVPVRLRPRQLEILTLLVLEGRALSPEFLREALYGDRRVTATTLKAEVSHLRRALQGALSTRRYELTEPVGCDAAEVLSALRRGRVDEALRSYRGPLLPDSEAPGITIWREHIEVALREAVLRTPSPEPMLRYGELHHSDLEIHERALAMLGDDPRRGIALARLRAAQAD